MENKRRSAINLKYGRHGNKGETVAGCIKKKRLYWFQRFPLMRKVGGARNLDGAFSIVHLISRHNAPLESIGDSFPLRGSLTVNFVNYLIFFSL